MIAIISAIGKNYEIGYNNELIWNFKEDLNNFKKLTTNNIVVMGKNTFYSLKNPLKERLNVVISKTMVNEKNILIYHSIDKALLKLKDFNKDIFFIGGNRIYKEVLDKKLCDTIFFTKINDEFKKADTFFPYNSLNNDWKIIENNKINDKITFLKLKLF
jgi:dihydrofolate reductase